MLSFVPIPESEFESVFSKMKAGLYSFVETVFGWDDDFQRARMRSDYEWSWMHWVESDGDALGFVCFKRYDQALHVHLIVVDEEHQGQGRGKEIMHALEAIAREEARDVTLSSFKLNSRAISLYRSLGYQLETQEEHFNLYRLPYKAL
jgi:ribosomal protein S18 acetylase RimI-like enzyme